MKILISALAMAGLSATALAQQFLLSKTEVYYQTSASTPALFTGAGIASYSISVQLPAASTITPPGLAAVTVPFDSSDSDYEIDGSYATKAALDAAYPNGTYSVSTTGFPTFTLSLTGDLYPATIPQVTGGTWQNGVLVLNPAVSNTITLSTFSGYGSTGVGNYMGINISSATSGDNINLKQSVVSQQVSGQTFSSTPFTSYTIPANTMKAGLVYNGSLNFGTLSALNTTTISGGVIVGIYENNLQFYISTQSTPAVAGPTIATQPSNVTGPLGSSVTIGTSVTFGGSSQLPNNTSIQWYLNGQSLNFGNGGAGSKYLINFGGGTGGTGSLTINSLAATDAGTYVMQVVNAGGLVFSNSATVTIGASSVSAPVFTTEPVSKTIASGSTVVFSSDTSGSPTPTYQWYLNGNAISGATLRSILISGATSVNAGTYTCTATNSAGSATTTPATLTVITTTDPGRLINLSTRAQVGTGANVLIVGFVIGGSGVTGTKPVLVRGSGPALNAFGVTGTLPDPFLQLSIIGAASAFATNSAWGGNAAIAAEASAVGAQPFTNPSSNDTAIYFSGSTALAPNGYTAEISGASGDTGVALAEVYDATPTGTYTATTPRLTNLSARVQVGTGANVLIAGFVVGGSSARTVLIRGSGPALGVFGVTGTLPDPLLQLTNLSTGAVIATNSAWGGSSLIASVAASVGAQPFQNPNSNDTALVITLPPGPYSAQVSGASGDTGVALVEVYEVP